MARPITVENNGTENSILTVNIEMRKHSKYRLNEDSALTAAQELMSVINRAGSRWTLDLIGDDSTQWMRRISQENAGPSDYAIFFRLTGPNSKTADMERDNHILSLSKKGASFKGEPWKVNRVNGAGWTPPTVTERLEQKERDRSDTVAYSDAKLPDDLTPYFKDMYGVDAQIRILKSRIGTAIKSDFGMRFHAILMGAPGCGKSQMLACFKEALIANDPNSVLSFDGAAITSQGILKALNKLDVLPRFIFVEEIEKAPNDAVAVFLGLMDDRGQLRKTTYKEDIEKDCRVIVFATANSEEKLNSMQSGALASRFVQPVRFTRPSDDTLRQILRRDLDKMGITTPAETEKLWNKTNSEQAKWIEATLEWCHRPDVHNLDPRYVRSVCINGGPELLTGEYQSDLETTMKIESEF